MLPFQSVLPAQVRRPLCSYFSPDKEGLLKEITVAYRACRSIGSPGSESRCDQQQSKQLLALVVRAHVVLASLILKHLQRVRYQ